jgi:hypothetical protein
MKRNEKNCKKKKKESEQKEDCTPEKNIFLLTERSVAVSSSSKNKFVFEK